MNVTTWVRYEKELSPSESNPSGRASCSVEEFRPQAPVAEGPDMSPFARKMVALALFLGVLYLAGVGGWLWYGAYQFQNMR